MHVLVTGGAGFIGSHLVDRLLAEGRRVTVVDSLDTFYDPAVKRQTLDRHAENPAFRAHVLDIRDAEGLRASLKGGFDAVVHLAAKAGVRPSVEDPVAYTDVNIRGTQILLQLSLEWGTPHFVFASSSSVYGVNPNVPWSEADHDLRPISPYAATKLSGEFLGHACSHLHGIRFIALRLFTVYGPRQRPDLAIHKFARRMLEGRPITLYGEGATRRDYTYVSDIVEGIVAALEYRDSPFQILNLGNTHTVSLGEMVRVLEEALGVRARIERLPEQPGDVPQTWADISRARALLGYAPRVPFAEGIARFAEWLRESGSPPHPPSRSTGPNPCAA